VLLGSDAPFPIADPDPVGTVRSADLSAETKRGICCDNARTLA
jgi:predicted TIM-barrel fold metal-dependent hydrolase